MAINVVIDVGYNEGPCASRKVGDMTRYTYCGLSRYDGCGPCLNRVSNERSKSLSRCYPVAKCEEKKNERSDTGANGSFVNYSAKLILIGYKTAGIYVSRPFRAQPCTRTDIVEAQI